MPFVSIRFVIFFVAVLAGLRWASSRNLRHGLLLLASALFYAAWKPSYLLLLAAPVLVDWYCALRMQASLEPAARKRWLAAAVGSNLLLLAYFKYANFFLASIAALKGVTPRRVEIALPLGISFFTFKGISYLIDVYRGDLPPCPSLLRFATYLSYFPDLLAGPIVRASVFLPQLKRSLNASWPRALAGCQLILLGLIKKLLIADQMAIFTAPVFAEPATYSPLTVWSAVVAYSLEIYCDFSGYSDMAIGMSRIIGIDLPENFNMPYLARSPIEFWRRWHITLSNWLRDYVFFSLPGLRRHRWNRYRNVAITALLGGLWHGASWTFVAWGALHGVAVGANHWWIDRRQRHVRPARRPAVKFVCWLATYLFLCVTWVLFRAPSFATAFSMLRKMTGLAPGGIVWLYSPLLMVLPLVIAAHLVGIAAARRVSLLERARKISQFYGLSIRASRLSGIVVLLRLPGFAGAFLAAGAVLALLLFGAIGEHPFIYFQF